MSKSIVHVVTWLWASDQAHYNIGDVDAVRSSLLSKSSREFRFHCIADRTSLVSHIEWVVPQPLHLDKLPRCYRRLAIFDCNWLPNIYQGDAVICIDLDVLIYADIFSILPIDQSFWSMALGVNAEGAQQLCGSLFGFRFGDHLDLWHDFINQPRLSALEFVIRNAGFFGSDQGWLSLRRRGCTTVGQEAGIFCARQDLDRALQAHHSGTLKAVFLSGQDKRHLRSFFTA